MAWKGHCARWLPGVRVGCVLGVLLGGCALGAGAATQPERAASPASVRPRAAARVVRQFDFEEQGVNPLPVPSGWFRGQADPSSDRERPGFPVWNGAELDYTSPARSGVGSIKLPTEGGSTSLILQHGIVPVFAQGDYRVSAFVRTDGLAHARAALSARLLDQEGRPIDGSQVRTDPVRPGVSWMPISVAVLGNDDAAAFLQVELLLLQPKQLAQGRPARAFDVWAQDFSGAAWFDDVAITQLPRAELSTGAPGNVVTRPDRPRLTATVRDLVGKRLKVEVRVHDIDGRIVDRWHTTLAGGRMSESWTPALRDLGWYRATITLRSGRRVIEKTHCDFAWLGESGGGDGAVASAAPGIGGLNQAWRKRFGVRVNSTPPLVIDALPELVRAIGVGSVTVPVWPDQRSAASPKPGVARIAPAIDALLQEWRAVTLAFDRVPGELAYVLGIDPGQTAAVFAGDPVLWKPYVDPYLDRFGQRVGRWQVGRADDERVVDSLPIGGGIDRVRSQLSRLVAGPEVVQPWRSELAIPDGALGDGRAVVVRLAPGTTPEGVGVLGDGWAERFGSDGSFILKVSLAHEPGVAPRAQIGEFVKQVVAFWEHAGPGTALEDRASIMIDQPWIRTGSGRQQLMPTPALAVWRQLVDQLGPRRVAGRLATPPGVRAFLLGEVAGAGSGGAIVAWCEDASDSAAELVAHLGDGAITASDPFGNVRAVSHELIGERETPLHRVVLSGEPVFVEGVDVELVRFLDSVRLEPGLIVARSTAHQHELVLENPWALPVRGRVFVLEPGGYADPDTPIDRSWTIEPRIADFSIPQGGSARIGLDIGFSAGKMAGIKALVLDIELEAGRDYGLIRVERTVELGLRELTLELFYTSLATQVAGSPPGARDVIVRAEVTNRGSETIDVDLVAVAPGMPRAKAFIYRLNPGETAVRAFPFIAGYDDLMGRDIAVGLVEVDGGGRLNKAVRIE